MATLRSAGPIVSDRDGARIWFRAVGEALGWHRVEFAPGRALAAGAEAWERFARSEPAEDVALAVLAIEALDEP